MNTDLTLSMVQTQVGKQQSLLITDDTIAEINKLAKDPDYGDEFVQTYIDHLNVMKENARYTHPRYLHAIKFFSLIEGGNSLTNAYIKTFPDRFAQRTKNIPGRADKKAIMRGEASRYNQSKLVNDIRHVATIPVQLIHRHLLHEAILGQAELMRNAKSEMVRQKAGATLILELKPTEDHVLQIKVDDGSSSVIEELRLATERLAVAEYQSVKAGVPMKEIAASTIIEGEVERLDD